MQIHLKLRALLRDEVQKRGLHGAPLHSLAPVPPSVSSWNTSAVQPPAEQRPTLFTYVLACCGTALLG